MSKKSKQGAKPSQTTARQTPQKQAAAPTQVSAQPLGTLYSAGPALPLGVQRQVTIGRPDDRYETEADAVANSVVRGEPAPLISPIGAGGLDGISQRQEMSDEQEEVQAWFVQRQEPEEQQDEVQTWSVQRQEMGDEQEEVQAWFVQRQEPEEQQDEMVQRDGTGGMSSMQAAASSAITNMSGGSPLVPPTQHSLEQSIGRDLSDVRVHDDAAANESASRLNARAFTHGSDIWLGQGESQSDLRLMGHEAAHVLQQTGGVQRQIIQRDDGDGGGSSGGGSTSTATAAGDSDQASEPEVQEVTPGVWQKGEGDERIEINTTSHVISVPTVSLPNFKERNADKFPQQLNRPRAYSRTEDISQQVTNWNNAVRPSVTSKIDTTVENADTVRSGTSTQSIYFLKSRQSDVMILGSKAGLVSAALIPIWDDAGQAHSYQVDHIRELQLGGEDAVDGSNYELLDSRANASSGGSIKGQIDTRVREAVRPFSEGAIWTAMPDVDDVKQEYEIQFRSREFDLGAGVGEPGNFWALDKITGGDHIDKLAPLTEAEIESRNLRGSETELMIFTDERGGVPHPIPWGPGQTTQTVTPQGDWLPGFRLREVYYEPSAGGDGSVVGLIRGDAFVDNQLLTDATGSFEIRKMTGIAYGGRVTPSAVLAGMRAVAEAGGVNFVPMSPLELIDARFDDARGIVIEARVLPSVPLIGDAQIDLVVEGNDVYLRKTFDTGDFNLPGPVQITDSSLMVTAGTNGLNFTGEVNIAVERVGTGRIYGAAGADSSGASFELGGEFNFDTELFDEAQVELWYRESRFGGRGRLTIGRDKVRGVRSAEVNVNVDGQNWSADGTLEPDVPGVQSAALRAAYTEEAGFEIGGTLTLGGDIPGIRGGTLSATVSQREGGEGYKLRAEGDVPLDIPGVDSSIHVVYDDGAFNANASVSYERGRLSGSLRAGVTNQAVGDDGQPAGPPTEDLTLYGGGTLTLTIAPWLQGSATVNLLPNGEMEVIGEIGLPDTLELFPEKRFDRNIFTIGLDIPIVGVAVAGQRIGIFANISGGLDLSAGFGPGVLRDTRIQVFYNPSHEDQTRVTGDATFAIPASAGLRLFVRGSLGAGIPIVSASAGLEIGGELGLEGEAAASAHVEWTPSTGLVLDARGSIFVQPKFTFDITGFVLVEADLLLTTIELYSKRWQLASFEYGSDLRFGVAFPIHYQEGQPFDISFDDVEFTYPSIDAESLLSGLISRIA